MIRRILGLESRAVSFQDLWGKGLDFFGRGNAAAEVVTRETALQLSAVYGSVRILSDAISTLPSDTFVRQDGARTPFRPRPAWLDDPSPDFGMIEVLGQAMVSLLLEGNAYFAVHRDGLGRILFLEVLDPALVEPIRVPTAAGLRKAYRLGGELLPGEAVLHIPGMMLPGAVKGCSPIVHAAETMGLALAAQRYGAGFFGNSGVPGMTIEAPGAISDVGVKQLKAAWNEVHRGAGNSGKLAVLTEGAKFTKVSLAPEEAQFLQTRAFQVPDIARFFGVPPHLLADATGSTSWGSGLAEQNTAFAQMTVRPWAERLEGGFTRLLRSEGVNPRAFVKFNLEALQRGSFPQQVDAVAAAIAAGLLTLDEGRAIFDRPPLPKGATPPPPPAAPPAAPKEPTA